MRTFLLACLAPVCLFSAGAGERADADRARIAKHFADKGSTWTWVFCGDSITHGAVHTKGWRSFAEIFAERVRTELHRETTDAVINSGNNGQYSAELLIDAQYERQVRRFKPDAVLVMIGMNDPVRGKRDESVFRANLVRLVDRIRADGAIPVLQTSNTIRNVENPDTPYLQGYAVRFEKLPGYMDQVRSVAAEKDLILVDHFAYWSREAADPAVRDRWLEDPIHPGPLGHQIMARVILETLGIDTKKSACLTLEAGGPAAPRP